MKLFMPSRVIFDPSSFDYPLGKEIYEFFQNEPIEIIKATSKNAARYIPGTTPAEKYANSKKTILITTNKDNKLDICRPSADYQFSLVSNCPGNCEYCYLQTTQGTKPYIKVFVNLDDIFDVIKQHIKEDKEVTTFEAASLGDPLSLEHITGSIKKTIKFFADLDKGRLRVVTKFNNVDSLLNIRHNKHTHFRISINTVYVLKTFEHNTGSIDERIEALVKLADADYPIGFLVAPIMVYPNWKEEYNKLFEKLKNQMGSNLSQEEMTFELIQHRYTAVAKDLILQRFPKTQLDMEEENRSLKWGRFGRYKYVYPKEQAEENKDYLSSLIVENFPKADIKYFT